MLVLQCCATDRSVRVGREATEVVTVAVESTGTFKYECVAVPVGKFEYVCTDARV